MKTKAIQIHGHGGPEVMRWEEIDLPAPAAGEARIAHTAIGVNYSDINVRRGGFYLKHRTALPLVPGNEAAGVVESVGPGVSDFQPGDRVVYAGMHGEFYESTGGYAEHRNVPAERLIPIPDGVSDRQAAAMMLKGFTASLIVNRVFRPKPGDVVLIHSAAAGVAVILSQWSKYLGAEVVGTVGSPAKAAFARANGCDHTIPYREVDFVEAVNAIVPSGVSAVFDGVGRDTFLRSIDCLKPFGMAVNYGNASGPVPPLDLLLLAKGSVSICRPGVGSYIRHKPAMRAAASELFDLVLNGTIRIEVGAAYSLRDAATAHRDIEDRSVTGSVLLLP